MSHKIARWFLRTKISDLRKVESVNLRLNF